MKTFIFISLFFVSTMFAVTKTYTGPSGDWNTASNWTPLGVPTAADDVVIGSVTVTVSANSFAKSISVNNGGILQLSSGITLTVSQNMSVQFGGKFYMTVAPNIATLLVYGDYFNVGITDFKDGDVVVSGDVVSGTASQILLAGNLVVGGNIAGQFDTDGGDGTNQIYAPNPNAIVDITPTSVDNNVQPGTPVSPSESPALLAAVNTVIYGGDCPFTASISNQTGCAGGDVTMTVTTAASSPTYQWQVDKNDANGWTDLSNDALYSGVTSASLLITNVTLAMNSYLYRAKVTSGGCSKYGSYGILTVNNPSTTPTFSIPASICSGSTVVLPTTSNNGITGTWSPAFNSASTETYTFTPNPGQCASGTTWEITVNNCPAQNLASIESYVYTGLVKGAQSYLWEVTTLDSGGNPTGEVQHRTSVLRNLRITWLPSFAYNTLYRVRVASTVNNVTGSYGGPFDVKTPSATSTVIDACSTTINSMSSYIFSTIVRYSPGYRYTLTNSVSPFDEHIISTQLRCFKLNQLTDLVPGATYNVVIEVKNTDGNYLAPGGDICRITIPAATGRFATTPTTVSSEFNVISYPNPFTSQFGINVSSTSQEKIQIKVYDMIGRLVEQKQTTIDDLETSKIGNYYQNGIYNVIVSQGNNMQSLRVIKR